MTFHEMMEQKTQACSQVLDSFLPDPGQVLSLDPLIVACGSGALEITELQPEGKKKMTARAYINGLHGITAADLKFE